jgi:hypothetical protein
MRLSFFTELHEGTRKAWLRKNQVSSSQGKSQCFEDAHDVTMFAIKPVQCMEYAKYKGSKLLKIYVFFIARKQSPRLFINAWRE